MCMCVSCPVCIASEIHFNDPNYLLTQPRFRKSGNSILDIGYIIEQL
jgi:hypothetical protein